MTKTIEPIVSRTTRNGLVTGYCVEIEGTDSIAEFHSGDTEQNRVHAELFAWALREATRS